MRTRKLVAAAVAATFGLTLATPMSAHAVPAATDPLFGITATNKLISFAAGTPGTTTLNKAITGLGLGETIVGSDIRPANGAMYALTGAGKLYTVDPTTAVATLASTLTTALTGTAFDVDFNPVVDRLRVVSNTGQNLRVDVDSGATTVDTAINGTPTPTESAVAYTNPVAGALTTALYAIDTTADTLVITGSPNAGTATTVVGPLGINAGDVSSLDIAADGSLVAAITLQGAANTGYYTINPATGAATLVGVIGAGEIVTDLNIPLASQLRTFGLTASGTSIATMEGQGVSRVSKTVAVTGLQASETLVGIDVRPAVNHGELYAVGSTGRLYVVDPSTGIATQKGAVITPTLVGDVSIDFNPVADVLRVVTSSGQNLRVNPDTGVATADPALAYATGDPHFGATPSVVGIGFTNSAPGATSTVLYGIDSTQQTLVTQNLTTGALTTVGSLGLTPSTVGLTAGFDVGPTNTAYLVNTFSATTTLYRVDLTTGVATSQGVVPAAINDIARNDQPGYNFVAADGGVFSFGGARFAGSTGSLKLNKPVVGMSARTPGQGYWLVASDGGIFTFGGAGFYGSTGSLKLNQPVVGMAPTPSGNGYWLVASDGGIFSFGDAAFWGSTGAQKINKPIVGMAATKTGLGYYLFAADGGVFTFGDAKFYGSAVPSAVGKSIVGAGLASNGQGYYFAASDGTVYTNGPGAQNKGSVTGALNKPIVGISVDPSGRGYWLTAGDGGIFSFGPNFYGSTGAIKLNQPVVGISAS